MKLNSRKLLGFIITDILLMTIFVLSCFFAKDLLQISIIAIISGLTGSYTILITGVAIDKSTISKNFQSELVDK